MKLIKLDNGLYRIEDDSIQIEGVWAQIQAQLIYEFEIDAKELYLAIQDMQDNGHDVADFGINGTFTHSYSTSLERKVKTELKAIAEVREEFQKLAKADPDSPETKITYDRLMNLYFVQDVKGNLTLLGEVNFAGKYVA